MASSSYISPVCLGSHARFYVLRITRVSEDEGSDRVDRYTVPQEGDMLARRQLAQAVADRDRGLPAPRDERQTVAAYLTSWLEMVRTQVRESGYISYERRCRLYLIPRLGRVKLAKLSPQHVGELHSWMLQRGLSPTTVNHTHGVLVGHLAIEEG
jgi:integrase